MIKVLASGLLDDGPLGHPPARSVHKSRFPSIICRRERLSGRDDRSCVVMTVHGQLGAHARRCGSGRARLCARRGGPVCARHARAAVLQLLAHG